MFSHHTSEVRRSAGRNAYRIVDKKLLCNLNHLRYDQQNGLRAIDVVPKGLSSSIDSIPQASELPQAPASARIVGIPVLPNIWGVGLQI